MPQDNTPSPIDAEFDIPLDLVGHIEDAPDFPSLEEDTVEPEGPDAEAEDDIDLEDDAEDLDADDLDSDDDLEDTDDLELGEEEAGDELDDDLEDLDDDELGEDEEEDEEVFFDRKEFETSLKDLKAEQPEMAKQLEAAYKQMQGAFTKKTQEVAERSKEVEKQETQVRAAQDELREFAETLATDEGTVDFLLRVAVNKPEVFQKVAERFENIQMDEDEAEAFKRETDLKDRERKLSKKEKQAQMEARQARAAEVIELTVNAAKDAGITDRAALALVEEQIAAKIKANAAETGEADISEDEVIAAVAKVAKALKVREAKAQKATQRARRVEDQKAAKKAAKKAKRPKPPASQSAVKGRKPTPAPAGVDPLDHIINQRLGM